MMDKVNALAQFYKALGDVTRLRLVKLLAEQEPGNALCVGSLAKKLATTTSNISQHLRILKDLGLVIVNRRGYRLHYYLDQAQFAEYEQLKASLLGMPFAESTNPNTMEETTMCCNEKKNCIHPEEKPNPKDCTPEQIKKCHGEDAKHNCCEDLKA